MKRFVVCRSDQVWGEKATQYLIELFLNPNNELLGGEALDSTLESSKSSSDWKADSELVGILTADQLIKELSRDPRTPKTQMLECYALLATKQKSEVERAIEIQMQILNNDRVYIPALYGTAVGFLLLKQQSRARNQLKLVAKLNWDLKYGSEIENCWMLLADMYIQSSKYDPAADLLKKVIAVNMSCAKAFEYMGYIKEKESQYKDAAQYYSQCWKLHRKFNPAIGFKLAFNHLKSKNYTDAIDVCHTVLKNNPDYPKIKKEVMEKARSLIRV
jgi:tetratricopeptide (TPR) repeat protein